MKTICKLIKQLIMKFRQYIQVKDIDADPNTICPADGWIKPESPITPPVYPLEPVDEEIILLCDRGGEGIVKINVSINPLPGNVVYELFDSTNMTTPIHTSTLSSASDFMFAVATYPGVDYFVLKIRPELTGKTINRFYVVDETGFTRNWPIIYANLSKATNMVLHNYLFHKILSLTRVDLPNTMDNATSFYYAFGEMNIPWIKFPSLMPALTNTSRMFYNNTAVYMCYFPKSAPSLTSMNRMYYGCSSLLEHKMPEVINSCTDVEYYIYNCSNLVLLTVFNSANSLQSMDQFARGAAKLASTLIFPELPALTTLNRAFQSCAKLPYVKFQGNSDNCTTAALVAATCSELLYFEFPSSMGSCSNFTSAFYGCTKLKKVKMPDTLNYNGEILMTTLLYLADACTEIEGDIACGANTYIKFDTINTNKGLSTFNKPLAKFSYLRIGYNGGPLSYVDVDWANSPFASAAGCITLYGSLSQSEIDRIFTALPTVTGSQSIDVRYNTGYATCDKTIATAKGWTVD